MSPADLEPSLPPSAQENRLPLRLFPARVHEGRNLQSPSRSVAPGATSSEQGDGSGPAALGSWWRLLSPDLCVALCGCGEFLVNRARRTGGLHSGKPGGRVACTQGHLAAGKPGGCRARLGKQSRAWLAQEGWASPLWQGLGTPGEPGTPPAPVSSMVVVAVGCQVAQPSGAWRGGLACAALPLPPPRLLWCPVLTLQPPADLRRQLWLCHWRCDLGQVTGRLEPPFPRLQSGGVAVLPRGPCPGGDEACFALARGSPWWTRLLVCLLGASRP